MPEGSMVKVWTEYKGRIVEGLCCTTTGNMVVNNIKFTSVSSAARSITGYPTNGWLFWNVGLKRDGQYTGYPLDIIVDRNARVGKSRLTKIRQPSKIKEIKNLLKSLEQKVDQL